MKDEVSAIRKDQPVVSRVTRRQFLAWTGVAAAAGGLVVHQAVTKRSARAAKLNLPELPNQNPAFRALHLKDGELVLGTEDGNKNFKGFRLNRNGQWVWELCDGKRSAAQIAVDYAKATGRASAEAEEFLKRLLGLAIVVSGMYIVHGGGFPKAKAGEWYYQPPR